MKKIVLKEGKEKSLLRKHPWIFSGAIKSESGGLMPGDSADVFSSRNELLASGFYSPHSQIRIRVLSFTDSPVINADLFYERISAAHELRTRVFDTQKFNCYRIVNSESDLLPGLIIDKYDKTYVCQFLTAGMDLRKNLVVDSLTKLFNCKTIYERSDSDIRKKELLEVNTGLLYGQEPEELITVSEDKIKYYIDIHKGHKTGFYLDQRENRILVGNYAGDKNVLNCFSYTGGFGLWALYGGATKVVNVDSSKSCLKLSAKNFELNGFDNNKFEHVEADVFNLLRQYQQERREFDLIILDPPKFVDSKSNLNRAARGYKDINMLAFSLLGRNGFLVTFSCSGLMPQELFQKIVADAALDAKRTARIIKSLHQSSDHPVLTSFPEAGYLKGFLIHVQ